MGPTCTLQQPQQDWFTSSRSVLRLHGLLEVINCRHHGGDALTERPGDFLEVVVVEALKILVDEALRGHVLVLWLAALHAAAELDGLAIPEVHFEHELPFPARRARARPHEGGGRNGHLAEEAPAPGDGHPAVQLHARAPRICHQGRLEICGANSIVEGAHLWQLGDADVRDCLGRTTPFRARAARGGLRCAPVHGRKVAPDVLGLVECAE
mmetsp:Transcript_13672/g.36603  ORF Transcript_13672/g.36603 Transcript_13672/m.36603 type:complete len:211 (+) Transcript_13672:272-904(+)